MREINAPEFLEVLLDGDAGASRAFRNLVRATHPALTRYIGRYFRDPGLVQDILQDTYLAVHRALPSFESKSKLTTWVYSLAYHKICDRLSEKYRTGTAGADDGLEWERESPDPLADEAIHQARLIGWIREAAEGIPSLYRDAYRLRDLEGLSGEEAADALGITTTLIRVRLHRARCLIVDRMRKLHPGAFVGGFPL
jgi:RNA polymerase sigma-70 factor, ECF subfamily